MSEYQATPSLDCPCAPYTGTFLKYLGTIVENIIAMPERKHSDDLYYRVDEALQMSLVHRQNFAANVLTRAMLHLTDSRKTSAYPAFDEGDIAAWERLEGVRDWLASGPVCANCGHREGAHAHLGGFCPTPIGSHGLYLLCVFRELRCQANVPLDSGGAHGQECGKALLPGTNFCEEHDE